jgi:hypothetical protein
MMIKNNWLITFSKPPLASKTPKPVGGAGIVRGWKNGLRGLQKY